MTTAPPADHPAVPTAWTPRTVPPALRVVAWLNFIGNVVIIATGGAVRLTGSGLGCPTWPTCTPDSLVPTAELSYHSMIEFGNRLMSPVLGIIALLLLILVWRGRRARRDLFTLAWVVMGGILAQAFVGGITVWTGLNPFIVGFHYVVSLALVCVSAVIIVRLNTAPGPRVRAVPGWYAALAHLATLATAMTVVVGVLTTGAGPHAGDDGAIRRNGFDAEVLEHVHAWPGYVLLALTLALVVIAAVRGLPTLRWSVALLAVELVQVALGLYQARNGLPPLAVGAHMVLAALTAATMTVVVMRLKVTQPMAQRAHS